MSNFRKQSGFNIYSGLRVEGAARALDKKGFQHKKMEMQIQHIQCAGDTIQAKKTTGPPAFGCAALAAESGTWTTSVCASFLSAVRVSAKVYSLTVCDTRVRRTVQRSDYCQASQSGQRTGSGRGSPSFCIAYYHSDGCFCEQKGTYILWKT